ncbi:DUF2442 domain-containing protein [bacterium]|nr:DUF2442 domain-containing protein [bacterium]
METVIKERISILASRVEAQTEGLVIITANKRYLVKWENCSSKLAAASQQERMQFELSPSGYGIHWKLLDEDLSITGLVSC